MASSGDMWHGLRTPKENMWVPRKTAGMEFVRGASRHSRATLFDTRPHITKGFHLPEGSCLSRQGQSKASLPNLSIRSLSKSEERRLNPLILSKPVSKGNNFDRMLKGKSLLSTAQYYELKRLYEGRPLTPKNEIPCRLRALPKVRSITGTLEPTMYCMQEPITLLPVPGKQNSCRTQSDRTCKISKPRLKVCLAKVDVDAGLLPLSSADISSQNGLLKIEKAKSASGHLPLYIQEPSMAIPPECGEGIVCPDENRKSHLINAGRKTLTDLEALYPNSTHSETLGRVNLNLHDSMSLTSRQRGKTSCTSSDLGSYPQVSRISDTQPRTIVSKPDVSVKLKVIGNKPRSLLQLRSLSRRLTVTPQETTIDEEVLLETQTLRHQEESQLNVTGKKMENKANMQVVNFLNCTRDYRLGHVVSSTQSCCDRMANHWTANDLQMLNLRKLRKGGHCFMENLSPLRSHGEDTSIQPHRASSFAQADVDDVKTLPFLVTAGPGRDMWQREESTVQPSSSSSSSSSSLSSEDSDSYNSRSCSDKSSPSVRTSSSDKSVSQSEDADHNECTHEEAKKEYPPQKEAESARCSKTPGFPSIYSKKDSNTYKCGHHSASLKFIHACGRISPLPASSRYTDKRHTLVEQTLTAEGQPIMFASSAQRLASRSTMYRSPLPFPSKFQTSGPKWRLPSFSHNPWGSLIMTTSQDQDSNPTKQPPERHAKAMVTRKKVTKKPKVWRRKKRRQKCDSDSQRNTDISSRTGENQHSNLYFTPMYDLRYDQWKRQCHQGKNTPTCNLTIKATATPCRNRSDISHLNLGSASDGDESSDSEDGHPAKRNTTNAEVHHCAPDSVLERPLDRVESQHSTHHPGPQTNTGSTFSNAPTPSDICKGVELPVLEGAACLPRPAAPSVEGESTKAHSQNTEYDKGNVENHEELTTEISKSGDDLILSSSEVLELENSGRMCTCLSATETMEYPTDSEGRPEYWNIAGILRNSKMKKKQTTAGDTPEGVPRNSSRDSSYTSTSTVWVTDSLSVAPIGPPNSTDTVTPGPMRLESESPRKRGDRRTDEVSNRTLTLQKILGFLPNIGLIQSNTREQCDHETGGSESVVTPCSPCVNKTSQEQAPASELDHPSSGPNVAGK